MILSDQRRPATAGAGNRTTLDELFLRAVARRPNEIALIDPPNREDFTGGEPRRLTYAEADCAVEAIAARLRQIGLHTDTIVGLQMANTIDSVLTLLGVLRAGLIAMPLPMLWRRADLVAALSRVSANALIVNGRIGSADHFDLAMQVAAEIFPVRYICGFGPAAPDGLIPLDDIYTADVHDRLPPIEREDGRGPGAHLAAISWDMSADGLVPVARSHAELIAGGLAVVLEPRLQQNATLLTTLAMGSFGGLATSVIPWLLTGGTLALHHPFDPAAFGAQRRTLDCDAIVVPGSLVPHLAEAGLLGRRGHLECILGVWRSPERLMRAPTWQDATIDLVDVQVFGEVGLVAARRAPNGRPAAIPFGPISAPRGAKGALSVGEIMPTAKGALVLRGPMVPRFTFPPGADRTGLPHFNVGPNGFADTGYGCYTGDDASALTLTGPPPGIVSVGGYRFVMRHLQRMVRSIGDDGALDTLPDALAGYRLAGRSGEGDALQQALNRLGANPLVAGAFREQHKSAA